MFNKIKCKRGDLSAMITSMVVIVTIILLMVISLTSDVDYTKKTHLENYLGTACDIAAKRGKIDHLLDQYLRKNIEKIYDRDDYELHYLYLTYDEIDTTNYKSAYNVDLKTGDVVFIQFNLDVPKYGDLTAEERARIPTFSKIIELIPFASSKSDRNERSIVLRARMVEVNAK